MERRTVAHMMETASAFPGIRRLIAALTAVPYFDHLTVGWTGFMHHSRLKYFTFLFKLFQVLTGRTKNVGGSSSKY